jgi:hypothetical protein
MRGGCGTTVEQIQGTFADVVGGESVVLVNKNNWSDFWEGDWNLLYLIMTMYKLSFSQSDFNKCKE